MNYKITLSGKCLVPVWHRASVNKWLLPSEVLNHLGPRTVLLHDRKTRVMPALSLIHLHSENLVPWELLKGHLPQEQLRGQQPFLRLERGPKPRGGCPQASQALRGSFISLTPWVDNCPPEPRLGCIDVPEPLRWVLCLPAVAWPVWRTKFCITIWFSCNFASNTCPIKYSNIKDMCNLENGNTPFHNPDNLC